MDNAAMITPAQEEKIKSTLANFKASARLATTTMDIIKAGKFSETTFAKAWTTDKNKPGLPPKSLSDAGRARITELKKISQSIRKAKDSASNSSQR